MCETNVGAAYTRQIATPEEMHELGASLAPVLEPDTCVLLLGDLGAGKTQFTQGVARGLGIDAAVTSPTFNILISYPGGDLDLHHFDLYRLEDRSELDDIGYYEVLESGGVCFIEWADKFPDDLPDEYLSLTVTTALDGVRTVAASATGSSAQGILDAWLG